MSPRIKRLFAAGLLLASVACSGTPPVVEEPERLTLSLAVRPDLAAVDLVIESPVTLAALQVVITSDTQSVGLGPALPGPNGRVSTIFDDGERVPGRLLVGLADLNQNPLPRSGALARITLEGATPGATLGITDVVAVDIFGQRVPAEEIKVEGTVIP